MKTYSFYWESTGLFTGRRFRSGNAERLRENTPDGQRALEGEFDADTVRVNLETGAVESFRPRRPSDLHQWDGSKWDLPAAEKRRQIVSQIEALEAKQARPLREIATGSGGEAARDRLRELDIRIEALRSQLP